MRVRFWGTRGSIASPGPRTVRYGGNTSCVEVRTRDGILIVLDAGTGIRALGDALLAEGKSIRGHLLITHTHWDHIQGFPFFGPLFVGGNEWDVYAPRGFGLSLRDTLAGQMQYAYFPVTLDALGATVRYHDLVEGSFAIAGVRIHARYLNHPALTLGYRIEADGATLVYATDHECHSRAAAQLGRPLGDLVRPAHPGDRRHAELIADADLLIHDTQYTAAEYPARAGWGHSTMEYVADIAAAAGVRRLALFHHDPRRDDDALDALSKAAGQRLRDASSTVEVFAAAEGQEIELPPRAQAPRAALPGGSALDEVPGIARRPALVACGDEALRQRFARILADEHLPVALAGNRRGALEIAAAEPLSVALVERSFGDHDGIRICAELRACAATADLPLIVVGHSEDEAGSAPGVTDWLIEPFTNQYARTKLRAWLLRTRARWIPARIPAGEEQRLQALQSLRILDTAPEERFDRITQVAASTFDVPIAVLSLVDRDRQWFKSRYGDIAAQTPRDQSFCAHAVADGRTLVVPDALRDERFADNPLVTGLPHVRFYAGHPIAASDGSLLGTLCLLDHRPRHLGDAELQALRDLAALAERELREPTP